jgi:hypothetical protein
VEAPCGAHENGEVEWVESPTLQDLENLVDGSRQAGTECGQRDKRLAEARR